MFFPLAWTVLVKKTSMTTLWPPDYATQFSSIWLKSHLFFNPPPKQNGLICVASWKPVLVPSVSHAVLRH